MQRFLTSLRAWTCTVIINTMIMTVYLWHMTVLLLVLGASYFAGGFGLGVTIGSAEWWLTRPLWLALLAVLLIAVSLLLSPLERVARHKDAPVPAAWRLVGGAMMAGTGITLATLMGLDGNILSPTNTGVIALMLGGALVCGVSLKVSH